MDDPINDTFPPRDSVHRGAMVGRSKALRWLLMQAERVAATDSTVLVYGETGAGKELVARDSRKLSRCRGPCTQPLRESSLTVSRSSALSPLRPDLLVQEAAHDQRHDLALALAERRVELLERAPGEQGRPK